VVISVSVKLRLADRRPSVAVGVLPPTTGQDTRVTRKRGTGRPGSSR
jgi:hypothetical protein